ncbi:chlorohydrolase [Streptococcus pneumoniae]|nr:chlorohydrolase [Streptococcus pneumoniae]
MKIKKQTRKLAAGCSKQCFEIADRTDEKSAQKMVLRLQNRTDEKSAQKMVLRL